MAQVVLSRLLLTAASVGLGRGENPASASSEVLLSVKKLRL